MELEARAPKAEELKRSYLTATKWQFPVFVLSIVFSITFLFVQTHRNRLRKEALLPLVELSELVQLAEEGEYEKAAEGLELFVAEYPESSLVPRAYLRHANVLADLVELDGEYELRLAAFESSLSSAAEGGVADRSVGEARLKMARVLGTVGKHAEGLLHCDRAMSVVPEEDEGLRDEIREEIGNLILGYGEVSPEAALAELGGRIFEEAEPERKAELELLRGHILRRDGKPEEAEGAYGRVIELYPDSLPAAEARHWQGRALFDMGRYADAYTKFAYAGKLLGQLSPAEEAAFLAAESLFRTGNYEGALKAFQECVYKFGDMEIGKMAYIRVGECHLRNGELAEAAVAYYAALEGAPLEELAESTWFDVHESLEALYEAAEKAAVGGEYLTAYELLKPLAAFGEPRDKFIHKSGLVLLELARETGNEAEKRHLYLTSASMLDKLARDYRGSDYLADALWNAAEGLFEAGEYAAATGTYQWFAKSKWDDPRASEAIYKQGLCYKKLGLYDAAIQAFRVNEVSFPFVIYAYESRYEKGRSYLTKGDVVTAQKVFLNILQDPKFSPESSVWRRTLFSLGEAYWLNGDWQAAADTLREALERYPSAPDANKGRRFFAKSLMSLSLYVEAITELKTLISTSPATSENIRSLAEANLLVGDCYYALQEYRNALESYREAVRYSGKAVEAGWALFQMANSYYNIGEMDSARAAYKRAKLVISSLPEEAFAAAPQGLRKQFWEELLVWAASSTSGS